MTIVILICGGDKSTQDRDTAKLKNTGQIIGVKIMPKSLPYHPFLIQSLKNPIDSAMYLEAFFEE